MSWDIYLIGEIDGNAITLLDRNYTHNCNPMIRKAGLKEWPYDVDGWNAKDLGRCLSAVIARMMNDPETYKAMNPENGWGDYHSLLEALIEIRDRCDKFPSATVRMSA